MRGIKIPRLFSSKMRVGNARLARHFLPATFSAFKVDHLSVREDVQTKDDDVSQWGYLWFISHNVLLLLAPSDYIFHTVLIIDVFDPWRRGPSIHSKGDIRLSQTFYV